MPKLRELTDDQVLQWLQRVNELADDGDRVCSNDEALRYCQVCDCYVADTTGGQVLILANQNATTKKWRIFDVIPQHGVAEADAARILNRFAADLEANVTFVAEFARQWRILVSLESHARLAISDDQRTANWTRR